MQEVAKVLAQSYPQVSGNNLSTSDSDSVGVSENFTKNTNTKNTNTKSLKSVRSIANQLCDRLNNPDRYQLYCKFAWQLPEAVIWANLEQVLEAQAKGKARNPQGLFTWLCEQELET